MNRLEIMRHWVAVHYDYLTGSIVGTSTGIIIIPHFLTSLFSTIIICIITGFAGAFGAHLFKKALEIIQRKQTKWQNKPQP
jgi:hypothetical protein